MTTTIDKEIEEARDGIRIAIIKLTKVLVERTDQLHEYETEFINDLSDCLEFLHQARRKID